jgi:hypothetical protein
VIPEAAAIIKHHIDVIVKERWSISWHDSQAARHTKMHHKCAALGREQTIFRPPIDGQESGAGDQLIQVARDWPTQTGLPHNHLAHSAAHNMWRYTAAGSFNFR